MADSGLKSKKLQKRGNNLPIERWTIDRLDRETNTVRIEKVPLNPEFESVFRKGIEVKKLPKQDNLSWWKTDKYKVQILSIKSLANQLQLKDDDKLNENMVFWMVGRKKNVKVIHATQMARELTKSIYNKLADSAKEG